MTEKTTFYKEQEMTFKTLMQYVPIVAKVHGGSHPEFHEVHKLFEAIKEKAKERNIDEYYLSEEFAKMREVTKDYMVPEDVCESFEAVYKMLTALDEAYN